MKLKFLFFSLLFEISLAYSLFPTQAEAAFSAASTITIDHTKVPNTDQTDFPVLVSGTYSYLRTTGNGGSVTNANGYDIGFYTNSNCSTGKMAWETETYTASSGLVNYWVKVASLSHTADTVFYLCYGDATISTDQSAKTSVWDSNYLGVYHLPDGSSLTALDSTTNANNGTLNGSPSAISGQIGGGMLTANTSNFSITSIPLSGVSYTISAWFKTPFSNTGYRTLARGVNNDHQVLVESGSNLLGVYDNAGGTAFHSSGFNVTSLSAGWHSLTAAVSGSNTLFYVDGILVGTATFKSNAEITYLGNYQGGGQQWENTDEVRISNISRQADWIATEYNNQFSPSTFYSIAGTVSGSGRIIRLLGHLRIIGGTRLR